MSSRSEHNVMDETDVDWSQLQTLRARIRTRMRELNYSAKRLSLAIGQGDTYIHDLLSPKNKNTDPSSLAVQNIAKELQCNTSYLYGRTESVHGSVLPLLLPIPYRGIAEAGAFRQMLPPDRTEATTRTVDHPPNKLYPQAHHFWLDVRDDSMNACTDAGRPTPIYEGMIVICVDLASAGIQVESGKLYAVERTLDDGTTVETSIKRARVYTDRTELLPESTNPQHQKFVIQPSQSRTPNITVIGLVYSWVYNFQK